MLVVIIITNIRTKDLLDVSPKRPPRVLSEVHLRVLPEILIEILQEVSLGFIV